MGLFDNWFSGNKERNIPKIDDKKKDDKNEKEDGNEPEGSEA